MSNKDTFKMLVSEYIEREGISELMEQLDRTDFYTAPASTKYHDAVEGGLVSHSIRVFNELMDEVEAFQHLDAYKDISRESIAICALFHDLCKVGFYTVEMRNAKNDRGQWEKVPYYAVKDLFPYGHGEKSVYLLMQHLKLTDEEAMAIRWHMGHGGSYEENMAVTNAYNENPLAVLLHLADMKATFLK